VLAYVAATYLTHLIGTKQGAFHFQCRCIALRLGLDENDIVIRDFVFKNPPGYTNPAFVHVSCMTVAFDLYSIYEAVVHGKHIRIHHVELAGVDVHIEKGSDGAGLNLWACLGATNDEQAKEVEGSVHKHIAAAVKATADGTVMVVDVVAKYNPASLLYKGLRSAKFQKNVNKIASNTLHAFDGISRKSSRTDSMHEDIDRSNGDLPSLDCSHGDDSPPLDDDSSPCTPLAAEYENSSQRFSIKRLASPPINDDSIVEGVVDTAPKDGANHWGIPYTLHVKEFTLRNVNIFAQDFISAEHDDSSDLKSHAIRIKIMNLSQKELTDPISKETKHKLNLHSRDCHHIREPIYFDDLAWRVIGKAVNEVFTNNKLAVTKILAHAAFSHTASLAGQIVSGQVMVDGAQVVVGGATAVAGVALEGGKAVVDGASGVVLGGGKLVVDGASGVVIGGGKAVVDGANMVGGAMFGGGRAVVGRASVIVKGVGHTLYDMPSKRRSDRTGTPDAVMRALSDEHSDCDNYSFADDISSAVSERSPSKVSEAGNKSGSELSLRATEVLTIIVSDSRCYRSTTGTYVRLLRRKRWDREL
jgi:hypothetical protein